MTILAPDAHDEFPINAEAFTLIYYTSVHHFVGIPMALGTIMAVNRANMASGMLHTRV
jgi:hypothetical protein